MPIPSWGNHHRSERNPNRHRRARGGQVARPSGSSGADHLERVARGCAGLRWRNRLHLVEPLRIEHDAAVDRAVVQLEAEEPREVAGAGVQAAGCRHRHQSTGGSG